jgi:FOG: EAL domain
MKILKQQFSVEALPLSITETILLTLGITFCFILLAMYAFLHLEGYTFLESVSEKLLSAKKATIERTLNDYVSIPQRSNAIIVNAIGREAGEDISVRALAGTLANNLNGVFANNHSLDLVEFGSRSGDFVSVSRARAVEGCLGIKDAETNHQLRLYSHLSTDSAVSKTVSAFTPQAMQWYQEVLNERRSHWTRPFINGLLSGSAGFAWASPAFNRDGTFVGVVASELHFDELTRNLQTLKPYSDSTMLIVDDKNALIASSGITGTDAKTLAGKTLAKTGVAEIIAADEALKKQTQPGMLALKVQGRTYYVDTFPVQDQQAQLRWKGVIISPAASITREVLDYGKVLMLVLFTVCALGFVAVVVVLSRVTRPLQEIARKADELVTHRWTPSTEKRHFPEIASLETTFMALSHKLAESFELQRKKIEEDETTRLWTTEGLRQHSALYKKRNLVGLVQIRNMYSVVNALGSEFGDAFINEFVRRLRELLPSDTLIARDTKDKLLLLFPGVNQQKDVLRYQALLASLFMGDTGEQHHHDKKYVYIGNAGIVMSPLSEATFFDIRREAGIALLQSMALGNGGVELYCSEMYERELKNIQLHEHLYEAIHQQAFHLVLQPIVDHSDEQRCREGECLLRWHSAELGDVAPGRFIPLAEETGLIIPLGKWVIEQACRDLAAMIARGGPKDFLLHINVSAIQLQQQDFAWHLMDCIRGNGLVNGNICIEITESVLMQDRRRISKMLGYLRRHDIAISLDDFGSGFSNLAWLHELPFDSIKIDRNFVSGVVGDEKAQSIISSLIVLASEFNVPLIAEGIEDEAVQVKLRALGCHKAQGFYFCRPAPFSAFHCADGEFFYRHEDGQTPVV